MYQNLVAMRTISVFSGTVTQNVGTIPEFAGIVPGHELSTVRSARVPTPHNRSQHIQANTTRGFIQPVLLTMGIMMPQNMLS